MKINYSLVWALLFLIPGSIWSQQAANYSLSVSNSTFVELGASATAVPILGDGVTEDVPIGFNFTFEGVAYDTLSVSSDGFASFVVGSSTDYNNDLDNGASSRRPLLAPLWDDLDGSANTSAAAYEVTGTAPNRVFTMEWRDWEWNWLAGDSVVSFQLKLYETSEEIEFHYRWECSSCQGSASASIGLSGANSFLSVSGIGTGSPSASSSSETSSIDTVVTDQVLRFVPPACPSPSLDSLYNITATTVDADWSGTSSDDVVINWGPAGFDQATSTAQDLDTTNAGTYSITGLSAGIAYDVYLRRLCAGSISGWVGPFTVRTTCPTVSVPYSESFDFDLGCFSITDGGSTSDTWFWTADDAGSTVDGNPGFAFVDSDAAGSGTSLDEFLTSPVIDASGLSGSLILEFDQYYRNAGDDADVEVYDGSTWVTVLAQSSSAGGWGSPDHQRIDITQYANANLQVRFHYYNASWDWYWAVDNFSVEEVLCNPSTNLGMLSASSDSITINWEAGTGSTFGIEYGPAGFSLGSGTMASSNDTTYTANGLNPSTAYDFYVIDSCGGGTSSQAVGPLTVNTTCTSVAMPYLEDFETWPLSCWDSTASQGFNWIPYGTSPNRHAQAEFYSNSSGTAVISSRPITVTQDAQLRFYWSHSYSTVYPDDRMLVRAKAQTAGAVWDTIFDLSGPSFDDAGASNGAPGSFTEEIIFLDPATYTGNDVIIEFHGISDWGPDLFLDSVNVEALPSCAQVQNLRDTNRTAWESTLKWDDIAGLGSSYQVWFGPQGFYQGTQTTGGSQAITTADTLLVDTLNGTSCYEFLVRSICSAGDTSDWTGPFSFCTPPSCPAPADLAVSNEQLNQVDLSWTSGGASDFNISVVSPGAAVNTGTMYNANSTSFTIGSLNAGTTYEAYVRDSCGMGDVSVWTGPIEFTTAYTTNFIETFDTSAFANEGWREADAYLGDTADFTSSSSSWTFDDYGNNTNASTSAKVNIYFDGQYEWLISPSIYLDPSITNLQVEFDAAMADWNTTNQGYFGSDDSLALVISIDNGQTWLKSNIIWLQDANDTLDISGEHFTLPLTGYSGYVKFGFYAGSAIDDTEDNDWFIDNFEVRTPRPCSSPSALTADGITTNSAVARWAPGDTNALGWEVILTQGNQPASAGTVLTATAFDSLALSGLMDGSEYCFYVVEECANGFSDTIGPHCFNTECNPFTAPYYEGFESGGLCWKNEVVGGAQEWTVATGSTGGSITAAYAGTLNAQFSSTGSPADTAMFISPLIDVSALSTVELSFYYAQEVWAGDQNALNVYYRDNATAPWILLYSDASDVSAWTLFDTIIPSSSSTLQIAFEGIDNWGRGNVIDEVRIQEPSCAMPTAASLVSASCDTLSIDWTSQSGGSILQYGPAGFTPGMGTYTNVVTAPFDITGLAYNTDYDIWVADTCGGDTSAYVGPFTVSTDSIGPLVASFSAVINSVTVSSADVSFDASASTNAVSYSWDFDNGNTGTGMNINETYTSNGSYNVVLTVTDRCGNTDDSTFTVDVQGISLEESALSSQVAIYPNPNQGTFNLELPNTGASFELRVSDLSGKVIHQQSDLNPDEDYVISLPSVAKGVYMIHLQSGSEKITKRLIVE